MYKRFSRLVFLGLASVSLLFSNNSCSQPAKAVLLPIEDPLTQPPASPWEWIRENPDTHKSSQNGLSIQLESGGLMGPGKDAKNILVRPLPEAAKSVQVNVQVQHQSQYEQAGLILYTDDDSYIKLVLEMVDGKLNAVMVPEVKANVKGVFKIEAGAAAIDLIFTLDFGKVIGHFVKDGKLQKIGEFSFPMNPRPRIGIFTQSGVDGAGRWATFKKFEIE